MRYSGPGTVLYRGRAVLQASSAEFDVQTGNNSVVTLRLGRAGHSPGARAVSLSVSSAIPEAGLEVDWVGLANAQAEVQLGFRIANKTYEMVGDVRDAKITTSTESPNAVSFSYSGIITSEL